ncbi:hypothetical protein HK097_003600 [Rhizophlyctis rosea]|uniref:RRM domain-containing protein n=1 Tax=Rhizophlyctis rosea TaxID=64517 RepID=A0AAD5S261_9FUNG|nr:hypothetical protein HK097_003600 [Rhizophlyctis rosea]
MSALSKRVHIRIQSNQLQIPTNETLQIPFLATDHDIRDMILTAANVPLAASADVVVKIRQPDGTLVGLGSLEANGGGVGDRYLVEVKDDTTTYHEPIARTLSQLPATSSGDESAAPTSSLGFGSTAPAAGIAKVVNDALDESVPMEEDSNVFGAIRSPTTEFHLSIAVERPKKRQKLPLHVQRRDEPVRSIYGRGDALASVMASSNLLSSSRSTNAAAMQRLEGTLAGKAKMTRRDHTNADFEEAFPDYKDTPLRLLWENQDVTNSAAKYDWTFVAAHQICDVANVVQLGGSFEGAVLVQAICKQKNGHQVVGGITTRLYNKRHLTVTVFPVARESRLTVDHQPSIMELDSECVNVLSMKSKHILWVPCTGKIPSELFRVPKKPKTLKGMEVFPIDYSTGDSVAGFFVRSGKGCYGTVRADSQHALVFCDTESGGVFVSEFDVLCYCDDPDNMPAWVRARPNQSTFVDRNGGKVGRQDKASAGVEMDPTLLSATMRTIYLGNLRSPVSYEELINHIKGGALEQVKILEEKNCAFVTFVEEAAAQAYHRDIDSTGLHINNSEVKIGWGKHSSIPTKVLAALEKGASRNVFLGNIDETVTEQILFQEFTKFGPIDQVKIVAEEHVASVHMASIGAAMNAVAALTNDYRWATRRVNYGKDRCENVTYRTVVLGRIPTNVTTKDLCDVIRGGILQNIKYIPHERIAFVTFVHPEGALSFYDRARLGEAVVQGTHLRVEWGDATPLAADVATAVQAGASRNVYIAAIDESITEDRIIHDFSDFGEIEHVHILSNRNFAIVNFIDILSAVKAFETLKDVSGYRKKISYGRDRCAEPGLRKRVASSVYHEGD